MTLQLGPPPLGSSRDLVVKALAATDELLVFARNRLVKAKTPDLAAARDALIEEKVKAFTSDISAYFAGFATRWLPKVKKDALPLWDPDSVSWDDEENALYEVLLEWYDTFGTAAYSAVSEQLGMELVWDLNQRNVKAIRDRLATEVKGLTDATRDTLRGYVDRAIADGSSTDALAKELAGVLEQWGAESGRAHRIALTESANAYNWAAINGYRQSGIVDEVRVLDGVTCGWTSHDDPDLANGSVRSLEDADKQPLSHPHCQRAFAPVVAR